MRLQNKEEAHCHVHNQDRGSSRNRYIIHTRDVNLGRGTMLRFKILHITIDLSCKVVVSYSF